jgi:hypothetical protein
MVKNSEFVSQGAPMDPIKAMEKVQGVYASNVPVAAGMEESSALAAMPKQQQPKPFKG